MIIPLVTALACAGDGGSGASAEAGESSGDASTGAAPVCGDGQLAAGEVCDGAELGGKQCADVDPSLSGALACAADCGSYDLAGCAIDPNAARVVLNEVTTRGATEGPYAGMGDALELYNAGGSAAQLAGWKLSDDPTFPADKTYVFPPGTQLAPGGWLVLVAIDTDTGVGDLPFKISATKEETLTLADHEARTLDQLIVDGVDAEVSYCRLPDGTGAWQRCDLTLGGANLPASTLCGDAAREGDEACDGADLADQTCVGLGFTGGELGCTAGCKFDASACMSDSTVALNELESTEDQIELYNAGDAAVDLSGWILTDDPVGADYDPALDPEKLEFPTPTSIGPKAFLVIAKGTLAGQHPFGLSATGDTVTLLDAKLTRVGQVSYGPDQATLSYCRVPDGPTGAWAADCAPTLGAANNKP